MNELTRDNLADLVLETSRKNQELEQVQKKTADYIENTAERLSAKSSQTLAGIIGGCIMAIPTGAAISIMGISMLTGVGGAVAIIFGIAGAMYQWRGRGSHKIERANNNFESAIASVDARIKALSDDAPQYIKDALWKEYHDLVEAHRHEVLGGMKSTHPDKATLPSGTNLFPAESPEQGLGGNQGNAADAITNPYFPAESPEK